MYRIETFNLKRADAIEYRASTGWLMKWDLGEYWIKAPGYIVGYSWDSVAEVIASCVAKDLNIENCLEYRLCIINLDNSIRLIGCISKNYKNREYREVTIQKMIESGILSRKAYFGEYGYNLLIDEIKNLFDLNIRKYLEDTILVDSITLNLDRNYWNISIFINKQGKGKIAPIYDFGNSLGLNGGFRGEFIEECMYSTGVQARPFSYSFEEQLGYIRNNRVYSGRLIKTKEILEFISNNFTVNNNTYGVVHPIPIETFMYTYQVIQKRYNTVIEGKIWKNN